MKKNFTILFLLCLTASCSTEEDEETLVLRINHHQQTATAVAPVLVYLVQWDNAVGTDNWEILYDEIDGFNYEPGYTYDLLVKKEFIGYTLTDGSSVRYTLMKLIDKEEVPSGEPFEIILKSEGSLNSTSFVTGDQQTGFKILDQIAINCNAFCEELEQLPDTTGPVSGVFVHQEEKGKLQLLEIKTEGF